jgi:uncharacterized peroxidase-related enzyme
VTRIAPIDSATAEPGVLATLSAVKAKLGMTPNLVSTFAQSAAVLNGYLAFADALGKGVLTARQREIVALVVAQRNACAYCLSAHSLMGKAAGLTQNDLRLAREASATEAAEEAVARFAARVVDTKGSVADADIAAARAAGLDDRHLVEVIANVALNVLTNYTNHAAQTDIDFPKVNVSLHQAA